MGYYSTVYAHVHGSDLIEFESTLVEQGLNESITRIDCLTDGELSDEGYAKYLGENLKWYSDYGDVSAVNAVFLKSKHSVLLRVGEEVKDEEYITGNKELHDVFDITYHTDVDF